MRIVHFVNRLDPSDGGTPAVVSRLAAAQASAGHDVCVASMVPACSETELARSYAPISSFARVTRIRFPVANSLDELTAASVAASLPERVGKPDFVHIHGLWRPLLLRAARYCEAARVPYAVAPHGMATRWAMSQKPARKRLALLLGWHRSLSRATFVHYLSEGERGESAALRISAPSVVIPNGVSLEEFQHSTGPDGVFSASLPARYVLFLGRLTPNKGLDLLVDSFARIAVDDTDVQLLIAGADFGYATVLKKLISAAGLSHRIRILGGVYGKDKVWLLRHALCLCHPTRHEIFSITLLEAMASSLPIITTSHANFAEIDTAGAGIVTDAESGSIADALASLLASRELRVQMGSAGLSLVRGRYEWRLISTCSINAYMSAVAAFESSAEKVKH
jgi:glycosyltransferase involved in cell wall biosynthesis